MEKSRNVEGQKVCRFPFAGSIIAALLVASIALAQASQQALIVQDNGQQPTVAVFERPDFAELRQPDFIHLDLPIFKEKLVLSDEQSAAIERRMEQYLAEFKKLLHDTLPSSPANGVMLDLGDQHAEI